MEIKRNNKINRNNRQKKRYIKFNNLTKIDKIKYGFKDFIRWSRFKHVKYKNFIKCNYFLLINIFIINILIGFLLCEYNRKVENDNNAYHINTKVCMLNEDISSNLKFDFNIDELKNKFECFNNILNDKINLLNKEISNRNMIKRQKEIEINRIASENEKLAKYTQDDLELLASITFKEANLEPYLGQKMVVQTILNRVNNDKFPDTIEKVVFQGNGSSFNGVRAKGFGFYTDKNMNAVINTILYPLDEDILYFFNPNKCRFDRNYKVIYNIGNHVFTYKWKEN